MLAVGHSPGGHAVGIGDTTERLRVRLLIRLIAPVTSRAAGYFPAIMLGVGENLPLGAMREWGRCMMMPRYFLDDPTLGPAKRPGVPDGATHS